MSTKAMTSASFVTLLALNIIIIHIFAGMVQTGIGYPVKNKMIGAYPDSIHIRPSMTISLKMLNKENYNDISSLSKEESFNMKKLVFYRHTAPGTKYIGGMSFLPFL